MISVEVPIFVVLILARIVFEVGARSMHDRNDMFDAVVMNTVAFGMLAVTGFLLAQKGLI